MYSKDTFLNIMAIITICFTTNVLAHIPVLTEQEWDEEIRQCPTRDGELEELLSMVRISNIIIHKAYTRTEPLQKHQFLGAQKSINQVHNNDVQTAKK